MLDLREPVRHEAEVVEASRLLLVVERAMVGRDAFEDAAPQVAPQGFVVRLVSERRGADVATALHTRAAKIVDAVDEVLEARLAGDRRAAPLRRLDLRGGGGAGDVHYEQGSAHVLGDRGRASRGFRLDVLGSGQRVVDRRRVTARQRPFDQQVDDVSVLGMHHRQRVEVAGALHARGELVVADHQRTLVGHEQLEGADAGLRHRGHVLQHRVPRVGDRHVKAVVHVRRPVGTPAPLLERRLEVVGLMLDREVDEARHSAGGRGLGAGVVVVGRHRAHERHRQVSVVVDQARQDEATGGVDDVRSLGSDDVADGGDLLAFDQHVPVELTLGRDDGSVRNQRRVGHVGIPMCSESITSTSPSRPTRSSNSDRSQISGGAI